MDIKEQLKDIKTQLRLSMNGVVSQSMREKGLNYKLNFGVELPRIKSIAAAYEKNHELAQTLWKEDIRECKILAGLLQPVETFFPEIADIWVENMPNIEIAELTCMNLFQHLPYAPAKSFHWIASEEEYAQICGFLTIARLLMKKGIWPSVLPESFWIRLFVLLFPAAIMCVMPLCLPSVNICSTAKNMHSKFAAW